MTTDQWMRAATIAEAILDEKIVNNLMLHAAKINPGDHGYVYLLLDVTLSQDRYDRLREIAKENGAKVIVMSSSDQPGYTVRIWP